MIFESEYSFGEVVYLTTDKDQLPRIVTSIQFTKGSTLYQLSCGASSSWHYGIEISKTKNAVVANLSNSE